MIREWLMVVAICLATAFGANRAMERAEAKHVAGIRATVERFEAINKERLDAKKTPLPPPRYLTRDDMLAAAQRSSLEFCFGAFILMVGRTIARRRQASNEAFSSLAVPCMTALAGLGLVLQLGYEIPPVPSLASIPLWRGPEFGRGFLFAAIAGFVTMAVPWDPGKALRFARPFLLPVMIASFVLLRFFGDSTGGAFITLLGFQPVELVKLVFAAFLAAYFAPRASKLLMHRQKILGITAPRPALLVGALVAVAILYTGVLAVHDLGVALVLSILLVLMFWVVTQATGWITSGLALLSVLILMLATAPDTWLPSHVRLRIEMWFAPWTNGFSNGDQLGRSLWAIAAGGFWGQGFGSSPRGALPAGYTDLIYAHLVEEAGFIGAFVYLSLLGLLIVQGLIVASQSRTADRALLATSLSLLVFSQWIVIFGGTTGWLPLTGIVVPFLSHGKTSMIVFVVLGALLVRLAAAGRAVALTEELAGLSSGIRVVGGGTLGALAFCLAITFYQSVVRSVATSAAGIVTRLGPESERPCGRLVLTYNPRVLALVDRLPRGPIVDRNGEALAQTTDRGERVYPLGKAMGTLLGPPNDRVLRGSWMVEAEFDSRLRGYEDRADELGVYVASFESAAERVLTPASTDPSQFHALARASLKKKGERVCASNSKNESESEWRAGVVLDEDEEPTFKKLPRRDLREFARLLSDTPAAREEKLKAWAADTKPRTVALTIDARLQRRVADALAEAAAKSQVGAASAVVIDVASGEVLARAQVPDFDPGATDVVKAFESPRFSRIYGPWPDRTGLRGIFQSGSIGKLATALAAARTSHLASGHEPSYKCEGSYTRDGWGEPIKDHEDDRVHGQLSFEEALGVSCNVFFSQWGLELGPDPLIDLFKAGLDVAWYDRNAIAGFRRFEPGAPGTRALAQSSFGQGAMALNVLQAARMTAAIANEGRYRVCSPHALKGVACEERELLPKTSEAREGEKRILAGMREVMSARGTGRSLQGLVPRGVRVYAKTGTAEAPALRDEVPYGFRRGQERGLRSHSWFVTIAEPDSSLPDEPKATGRLAVAVLVPRGGLGSVAAGPAAMKIISAAESLGYVRVK